MSACGIAIFLGTVSVLLAVIARLLLVKARLHDELAKSYGEQADLYEMVAHVLRAESADAVMAAVSEHDAFRKERHDG